MARMERKLTNELPLGPPIALAEWMDGIDLAKIKRRASGELWRSEAAEKPLAFELRHGIVERGGNMQRRPKHRVALRNIHNPQLARPRKDILKQVPVNRTKMGCVELACGALLLQLHGPLQRKDSFDWLQLGVFCGAEEVPRASVAALRMRIAREARTHLGLGADHGALRSQQRMGMAIHRCGKLFHGELALFKLTQKSECRSIGRETFHRECAENALIRTATAQLFSFRDTGHHYTPACILLPCDSMRHSQFA